MCTRLGGRDLVILDRSQSRDVITNCEAGNLAPSSVSQSLTSIGTGNIWIITSSLLCSLKMDRCYVNINQIVTIESEPLVLETFVTVYLYDYHFIKLIKDTSILYRALRVTSIVEPEL